MPFLHYGIPNHIGLIIYCHLPDPGKSAVLKFISVPNTVTEWWHEYSGFKFLWSPYIYSLVDPYTGGAISTKLHKLVVSNNYKEPMMSTT